MFSKIRKSRAASLLALILTWGVAGLLTTTLPQPLYAESFTSVLVDGLATSDGFGADDGETVLLIRYVGADAASGTVTVESDGNLTFKSGVAASEAADDAFECPVSGALGGIIDVSDTACNTLGEVVDIINGDCTGCDSTEWRAVIHAGLRTDSSNDIFLAQAETAANNPEGLKILRDTSTAFQSVLVLGRSPDLREYSTNTPSRTPKLSLTANPWADSTPWLLAWNGTSTYGSGTSFGTVYSVLPVNTPGSEAETVTTLWNEAGAATTVAKDFMSTKPFGIRGKPGEKMVVKIVNSAAASAINHYAHGLVLKNRR